MNRIIKFRIWEKALSRFLDWSKHNDLLMIFSKGEIIPCAPFRKSEYVIQQFTGLLDKNGKEIYEGDIVEWTMTTLEYAILKQVKWDDNKLLWEVEALTSNKHGKPIDFLFMARSTREARVVGNIFENSNLLV